VEMKKISISIFLIVMAWCYCSESLAFWGTSKKMEQPVIKGIIRLGKTQGALLEKKIVELTEMIQKSGDIKKSEKSLVK
jgi:hypothetical protein